MTMYRLCAVEWQDQDVYDGADWNGWSKKRVTTSPTIITKVRGEDEEELTS